jgi:hypothetical protein
MKVYYNPNIINVVNKLASGIDRQQISAMNKHMKNLGLRKDTGSKHSKSRGQGNSNSNDDNDLLDGDDSADGDGDDDLEGDSLDQIRSSCLYQMAMPEKFYGKKYGELVQDLFQKNIIPLGLYRSVEAME